MSLQLQTDEGRSVSTLLKDISPLHAEILEGKHDDNLRTLAQAIDHRFKIAAREKGIRKNSIVTIIDDPLAGHLAGKKARVETVNKKTVTILVVDENVPDWQWLGYRVSPKLIAAA